MFSWRDELSRMLQLAAPMMLAQGGLMMMGVVDTVMLGRVSALEMGAVSLGNNVATVIMVIGLGLSMGLEPLVSQAYGAGDHDRARAWFAHGLWLALVASGPLAGLFYASTFLFAPFGIDAEIAGLTGLYILARLPGVPFNILFGACRSYLTSVERVRPVLVAVVVANLVNAALDAVLLFHFELGAVGVGLATSACWALMFGLLAVAVRASEPAGSVRLGAPDWSAIRRVVTLGWPIGLQLAVEVGIFALVGLLVARLGATALAGHHIALTLASLAFMFGVGLAVATTTRVGMHVGAGDAVAARKTGFLAVGLGGAVLGVAGVFFVVVPETLAALFAPNDPEVVVAGAVLLRIAAVFSVSDGVQVVAAGALRGAGDTRWPFGVNAAAHWLVGAPLMLWLGDVLGARGLWWALSASLTLVAVILTVRFARLSAGPIRRVET